MPALKRFLFSFLIALAIFLFSSKIVFAANDVVINEFSPASTPEWIEIYNPNDQLLSLKEVTLFLDDNPSTTQKMSFCDNEEISAKSFKLITRPERSFWLSNKGDSLILKRGDDVIDSISYGTGELLEIPTSTQSATRSSDGGSEWIISNNPTPQGDSVSFDCPSPSPTPEPPTSTPTPEPPTSTPILSPTPTPKAVEVVGLSLSGEILGEEASPEAFYPWEATQEGEEAQETTPSKRRILPFVFLGLGLVFLAAAAYSLWYTKLRWLKEEG